MAWQGDNSMTAPSIPLGMSPRAWLLLCVCRERERVVWDLGSANEYARPRTTLDRPFTTRQLTEALQELEGSGFIERTGTRYELTERGRG